MLETLLESKSTRGRSAGGAIVSVTAHTALIAAALYATAQAHVRPSRTTETLRAVYFPPAAPRVPAASPTVTLQRPLDRRPLVFVEPHVNINLPPIDMTSLVSRPGDFGPAAMVGTVPNGSPEGGSGPADAPFRSDQVEKQVAVVPGGAPPRYPEVLRSSGVEGQVTAVFVVDEHGRAEEASFRFPRSDNPLFEDAVRVALRRMRFIPAEVGGRKVRQLVQMPFVFTLAR
jgi:periplasmic protein TonB